MTAPSQSGSFDTREVRALAELFELARALGGVRWVQGPGGNCSIKVGDELWVKASGTRFADVAEPGNQARVPLALAVRACEGDESADRNVFGRTPRPSLETYFHALGGPVVAHTHALGAMLYACSSAPYARQIEPGIVSIPYVRPGRGVAQAMREVLAKGSAEQLCILRSHGIVAYADSARRAIELTTRFDEAQRARAEKQGGKLPAFEPLADAYLAAPERSDVEGGVYRALPVREARESDPPRYLFPDAPVCASIVLVDSLADEPATVARALAEIGRACVLVDPSGVRLAVARTPAQLQQTCEVAAAHDWLEDALRARGIASYLPVHEPAAILSMPAEQYRMRLAATPSS